MLFKKILIVWMCANLASFLLKSVYGGQDLEFNKEVLSKMGLALKFVEFSKEDLISTPFRSNSTQQLIAELNDIYSQCNLKFRLESYQVVDPRQFNLPYQLSSVERMDEVRRPFDDERFLVIIRTGSWNHFSMGSPSAWTAMPGEIPSGAVVEGSVFSFVGIIAHEIGHYLNLVHTRDPANLMNSVIHRHSKKISESQCAEMKSAALKYRPAAIRTF